MTKLTRRRRTRAQASPFVCRFCGIKIGTHLSFRIDDWEINFDCERKGAVKTHKGPAPGVELNEHEVVNQRDTCYRERARGQSSGESKSNETSVQGQLGNEGCNGGYVCAVSPSTAMPHGREAHRRTCNQTKGRPSGDDIYSTIVNKSYALEPGCTMR